MFAAYATARVKMRTGSAKAGYHFADAVNVVMPKID